ncbi:MAG TPA: FAD-binding oxidoreductase [Jiangellaceae bacterium]
MSTSPAQPARVPSQAIVVGAGMVGLSTAWFLQERGVEVTVVDRTGVAAGSSWGNAGWLAPALTTPLPEPAVLRYGVKAVISPSSPVYVPLRADAALLRFLTGFARHSTAKRWKRAMAVFASVNGDALLAYDLLAAGGVAAPTKVADPFLVGFPTERERAPFVEEMHHVVHAGVPVDFEAISGAAAREIEPALGSGVGAAVRLAGQRYIDPGTYVNSLADSVIGRGGKILDGTTVHDVRDLGNSGVVVDTSSGELRADTVVLATGTWLNQLARPYGVRRVVQAGRGYSFSVPMEKVPSNPVYFPDVRVACTPLGDRLRVAGMMEFRRPEARLDPRRIRAIIEAARPRLQGARWGERTHEWVGSRPCTADGLPLAGVTRSPRVHVAGGHGMWGIALGPLTGRYVAEGVVTGQVPAVMKAFDPLR